jgi:prevent-host-death family protein
VKTASAAEAKAHFAELVREAESGRSVVITRHGKPVVALVSASSVAELDRLRSAGTRAGLASIAGGWKGSDELVKNLGGAGRTPPRKTPRLDE